MITIEEKIKLFYKLLNQSMDIHLAEDLKDIEDNYKYKIQRLQSVVDKEAKEIEEKAIQKAETRRAEGLSKSKVIIKKDIMALKEKYYVIFMDKFNEKLVEFVQSKEYKSYLSNIISKIVTEIKSFKNCDLLIYLSKNDMDKYGDFVKAEINKEFDFNISFKPNPDIIGGLIAEIKEKNIKIDSSIDAVVEDNKTYIMQTIFETLEAGDYNG
ncbi:V-type ATP synthase subunit E [Sedimentibacter sp.]|uniref:V-type ATP synthase subunit E n=1 Tax=Sedimentibacter sp. TaxID=1960295 RepID=UPI0028AEC72D|nr:V-type ATP synthase subunit E [Sedimentibacter sp.]